MDFVSKYVYEYDRDEYESLSEEEMDRGLDVSDSGSDDSEDSDEDIDIPRAGRSSSPFPKDKKYGVKSRRSKFIPKWKRVETAGDPVSDHTQSAKAGSRKRIRRADTNIVAIKFNKLIEPSNMHTGDAVYCTECRSILSHISQLLDDVKVWKCEFCGSRNIVDVESEELPKTEDVTYMLQPALSTTASGPSGNDESLVIFCVDISGSMCTRTEVSGRLDTHGNPSIRRVLPSTYFEDEFRGRKRQRQYTHSLYISRLEAMQAAVDYQLEDMMKNSPSRRVALITFNDKVNLIGDGKSRSFRIENDDLYDGDQLMKIGQESKLPGDIKQCRRHLGDKLFDVDQGGTTALGPALLIAVSMASKSPGSKVIVCTDGRANTGLGQLDVSGDDEDPTEFYDDVTDIANNKGVTVSVITLKGTDCQLAFLGKVSEETSGQVNIVDPLKLTEEFSTILANKTIATHVKAKMLLHKGLYFQETDGSYIVKDIGNVSQNSEVTFEFYVRTQKKLEQGSGKGTSSSRSETEVEEKKELPFQLQIEYTDTEGARALRVVTQVKPVTKDRDKAEKEIDMDLLCAHTAQTSAKLALTGEYTLSRGHCYAQQRLAWRNAHILSDKRESPQQKDKYRRTFKRLRSQERNLNHAQKRERATRGRTRSESEGEEDEDEDEAFRRKKSKGKKRRKMVGRKADMDDVHYRGMYQNAFK